ncbi:hypothetical protein COL5a_001974 [Colletotrichum fioriniae]|nr:hypothetical protein COL5a_001974 [Colletotrichum fioriniae]
MAHWDNIKNNTPFTWAGQSADDPFSQQQWAAAAAGHDGSSAQPIGPAGLLSTDAPRNDESLIKDFYNELQDDIHQAGVSGLSSTWPPTNAAVADQNDLPFDLAIGNGIDLDAAKPASSELARTSSQASSSGVDEEESVVFSHAGDFSSGLGFDDSFGRGFFGSINSPSTTFSDAILSTNHSLESSPVVNTRCPYLSMQAESPVSGASSATAANTPQSSVLSVDDAFADIGFASADTPRSVPGPHVSALSTGLANQTSFSASLSLSPTSPFYDRWDSDVGEGRVDDFDHLMWDTPSISEGFIPYNANQLGPSLVVVPPDMPDIHMGDFGDGATPDAPSSSQTHPIDYYLNEMYTAPRLTQPRSVPNTSAAQNPAVTAASGLLAPGMIPGRRLRRRSDPVRMDAVIRGQVTRLQSAMGSTTPASQRRSPVQPSWAALVDQAKETRNKKMVCIRCKHSKQKCNRSDDSFQGSCTGCDKHGGSQRWPGPCVRAHFEDLIQAGTCNYISQHAIYHPTLDNKTRIRRELPRQIQIDNLIHRVNRARNQFNLRVHQDGRPIYVLDLDACYEYLHGLRQQMDSSECSFQVFIDREILRVDPKTDDWERCMTQLTTSREDPLALLCLVNNMPSRAGFSYVFKRQYTSMGTPMEQSLNPENSLEAENLVLAAQLSKIMCRKLEVKAYGNLQRLLHESGNMDDDKVLPFLQRLGRILLTLRWRLSWWAVVPGDAAAYDKVNDDVRKQAVHARVQSLCRILYFYYCCVRRRLPVWTNVDALRGIHSRYPDTEAEIWDDFPGNESLEGFDVWMERGTGLIREAGVLSRLRAMGLTA